MEFTRKKKRGQSRKTQKMWLSSEGYRIVWRKTVSGVALPARFQATVRIVVPNYGGAVGYSFQMWDFTDSKHRVFKVRRRAEESCEQHRRLWMKACEATGIRGVIDIFGKLPVGIPLWARKKLNRRVLEVLMRPTSAKYREEDEEECTETCTPADVSAPSVPTKTSPPSASPGEPSNESPIPVSPADAMDSSTTRTTRRTRLKATATSDNSAAPPAAVPANRRRKSVKKRTAKKSKCGGKSAKTTTPKSSSSRSRGCDSSPAKSKQSEN